MKEKKEPIIIQDNIVQEQAEIIQISTEENEVIEIKEKTIEVGDNKKENFTEYISPLGSTTRFVV